MSTRRKIVIQTDQAPRPRGAYSQGIQFGSLVFTAGLGPIHPETGEIVGQSAADQTRQVILNLQAILQEKGLGLADVLKTTVHLQHLERDFPEFNRVYLELFPEPRPVRTTVGSTLMGILVEIDCIAGIPE